MKKIMWLVSIVVLLFSACDDTGGVTNPTGGGGSSVEADTIVKDSNGINIGKLLAGGSGYLFILSPFDIVYAVDWSGNFPPMYVNYYTTANCTGTVYRNHTYETVTRKNEAYVNSGVLYKFDSSVVDINNNIDLLTIPLITQNSQRSATGVCTAGIVVSQRLVKVSETTHSEIGIPNIIGAPITID